MVCDLFGTLLVSDRPQPNHREAARLLTAGLDTDFDTARRLVYPLYLGMCVPERRQLESAAVLRSTCDTLSLSMTVDDVCAALWSILGNGNSDLATRPGVAGFLGAVRGAGHELRLLSNCMLPVLWMTRLLDEVDLAWAFDACYFSSSGDGKKPELDFFRLAGRGHFAKRWMLGDSAEVDLKPAAELGWETLLVDDDFDWDRAATTVLTAVD